MNTGCLILAGGKSRRMGYRKSSLRLNGTTFLDKLIFELRDFPEILVSVDDAARHRILGQFSALKPSVSITST